MAAPLQRELIRGDSRDVNITVVDTSGNAFDLTGCTVWFTVNANANPTDDTSAAISKSTTTIPNPTSGKVTIQLTSSDTSSIAPGLYYFDAQIKSPTGRIVSRKRATITVDADITRSTA